MSGTGDATGAADSLALADGVRLAWERTGDGPQVLLVHGIGSSRKTWDAIARALVAAGYAVVRLDLRGFGDSFSPEGAFGMDDYLRDLVSFVDAVGLQTFHLVGHSLGGMIAQLYALDHPARVRSLALASTTSHNGRRANAFAQLMVTLGEHGYDALEQQPALREAAEATLREAFPAGVPLSMLKRGMERPNPARASAWRACIGFSTKDRLSDLRCPSLVTHGTADMLIPFRAGELVAQAIPGATWRVEEGAGHSLPKERASSFGDGLVSLLSKGR
ncbi:MAG: alpha/beta fold hydrolase [Polyangiaceae bacterium]